MRMVSMRSLLESYGNTEAMGNRMIIALLSLLVAAKAFPQKVVHEEYNEVVGDSMSRFYKYDDYYFVGKTNSLEGGNHAFPFHRVTTSKGDTVKAVRGIAELKKVGPGRVIETCDLSNSGIKDIPNLKAYTILRMNLSGNFLKTPKEVLNKLPRSLRELNVSNCGIGKQELEWRKEKKGIHKYEHLFFFKFGRDSFPELRVLNASNNYIGDLELSPTRLRHVDVSNNRITLIRFDDRYMEETVPGFGRWRRNKEWSSEPVSVKYLNVSNNEDMYYGIGICPCHIDTLLHENCAHGKEIGVGAWID